MITQATHKKTFFNKLGFTVLEFSIVLTIIALLISVITTSRILINKAKLQKAEMLTKSAPVLSILNNNGDISAKLWLEASEEKSYKLLNDEYVEIWYDKSPYGNDVANGTETNYLPRLSEQVINNSTNALYFDGDDSLFSEDKVPLAFGDDNYSIVAVWQTHTTGTAAVIWEQNASASASGVIQYARGCLLAHNQIKFAGQNSGVELLDYEGYENYISILLKDDQTITLHNLDEVNTDNIDHSTNLYSEIHAIGQKASDNSEYFIGYIAEIIVFDKILTSSEIEEIQKYLYAKYNIKR